MSTNTEAIRQELDGLKVDGVIRPADVVTRAKDPDSAMHGWFEWDDGAAAEEHRLWQARQLLRVHVTVERKDAPPTRAFVSLTNDRKAEGGGYRAMTDVLSDDELRAQLLADAFRELRGSQQKYRHLQQLSGVWAALDAAESEKQAAHAA